MSDLAHEVFGDQVPPYKPIEFKHINYRNRVWFAAEDVAEAMETLGQYKTARHIRENCC